MFMTWSERTRAEGFRDGKREGKKEAARETLRKILLRQLPRRFGPLPETVKKQVEEMTSVPRLTVSSSGCSRPRLSRNWSSSHPRANFDSSG
jgi:hypothetical protein